MVKNKSHLILLIIVLIYGLCYIFLLRTDSLLAGTSDNGVKLLQIHSLSRGYDHIPYPARDLDPELIHHPADLVYAGEGEIHSIYSNVFPEVVSYIYKFLGVPGMGLVPLVFGMLSIVFAFIIAGEFLERDKLNFYLVMVSLTTPVFYYSTIYWEHTCGTALFLLAVLLIMRSKHFALTLTAGLAAGLACEIRPEMHLWTWALILGFGLIFLKQEKAKTAGIAAGYFLATITFQLFQSCKTPGLSPHFTANIQEFISTSVLSTLSLHLNAAARYLLGTRFSESFSFVTVISVLLYLVPGIIIAKSGFNENKPVIYVSILLLGTATILSMSSRYIFGLLVVCPIFYLGLNRAKRPLPGYLRMTGLCALFASAVIILSGHTGEYSWGPRFLLPLFPLGLLIFLYQVDLKGSPTLYKAMVILSIFGLLIQLEGIFYRPFFFNRMLKNELAHAGSYPDNTLFVLSDSDAYITCNLVLADPGFYFRHRIISADKNKFTRAQRDSLFWRIYDSSEINEFVVIGRAMKGNSEFFMRSQFEVVREQRFHYFSFYHVKKRITS